MALVSDLTLIVDTRLASFVGDTQQDGIVATGNTQGTAFILTASVNRVITSVAGVNEGVILPRIVPYKPTFIVIRVGLTAANVVVYPGQGERINENAVDAPTALAPNSGLLFFKVSSTRWVTV